MSSLILLDIESTTPSKYFFAEPEYSILTGNPTSIKGKFDWLKKLNIFKKSEAEKKS